MYLIIEYTVMALGLVGLGIVQLVFYWPRKSEGFFTCCPFAELSESLPVPLKLPKLGKRPITFISDFEFTMHAGKNAKHEFGFGPYMYGIGGYKFELNLKKGDRVEITGKKKTRINDVVVKVVPFSELKARVVDAARSELIEIEKSLR